DQGVPRLLQLRPWRLRTAVEYQRWGRFLSPGLTGAVLRAYNVSMTKLAEEAARLVDMLPEDKAQALLEYARYLVEKADEEEWQRRFTDPKHHPKLSALMAEVEREIAAGQSEPLDLERL